MEELKKIFLKENVEYDDISKYIEKGQKLELEFIVNKIIKFDSQCQSKILDEILQKSDSKEFSNTICMNICEYVQYEHIYYKKIVMCIAEKMHYGIWIEEVKRKIIEDAFAMTEVLCDFSKKIPKYAKYDIEIISTLLEIYNEKYIQKISLKREQAINICKKLNSIITIHQINILNIYCFFDKKFEFNKNEFKEFVEKFCFNYMHTVMIFLKNNTYNSEMMYYLKGIYEIRKNQNKQKLELKILAPNSRRIIQYRKYENKRNLELRQEADKQSLIFSMFKSSTILYGNRYGMIRRGKKKDEIFVSKFQCFSYEHEYPLEYLINPAKYMKNRS